MLRHVIRRGTISLESLGDLTKIKTGRCIEVLHNIVQGPITDEALNTTSQIIKVLSQRKGFKFTPGISNVLGEIYSKGTNDKSKEHYMKFLSETFPLEATRFHIKDLIQRNGEKEYQMAIDLFWDNVDSNDSESALKLHYFQLLQVACELNDTEQIIKLFHFMDKLGHLSSFNYIKILLSSLKNQNPDVAALVYSFVSEEFLLTERLTLDCALLFAKSSSTFPLSLEVLSKIPNKDVKKKVSLEIAASLGLDDTWILIDNLISSGVKIEYFDLPTRLVSIPQLDRYSIVNIHIQRMSSTENIKTKKLYLYSLLSSIDKTNVHFGSVAHILRLIEFDYHTLLDSTHFDIMLHVLSHYGAKVSCIRILLLMKQLKFKPSLQNYFHAMKCQCFGEETNLLPLLAIQALKLHGKLNADIMNLITHVETTTNNPSLLKLINPSADIGILKATFDYSYLVKSFHYKDERAAALHPTIKGYGSYNTNMDSHFFPLIGSTIRHNFSSF